MKLNFLNYYILVITSKNSQKNESVFDFNYNCAYVPLFNEDGSFKDHALIVRCQNQLGSKYSVGPSKLSFSSMKQSYLNENNVSFTYISNNSVVLEPNGPLDNFGTEDPRVAYDKRDRTYYMTYSAVQQYSNGTVTSRLALATSKNPSYIFPTKIFNFNFSF